MKPECLFSVTLRDEELTTFVVIAQSEDAAISALKESGTAERDQVGRVELLASLATPSANIAGLLSHGSRILGSASWRLPHPTIPSQWPSLKALRDDAAVIRRQNAATHRAKQEADVLRESNEKKFGPQYAELYAKLENLLLGARIPVDVCNPKTGDVVTPANVKITHFTIRRMARCYLDSGAFQIEQSPLASDLAKLGFKVEPRTHQPPMPPLYGASPAKAATGNAATTMPPLPTTLLPPGTRFVRHS